MTLELTLCLLTLFGLAGIGTPVGYSIMMASIIYFTVGGFDVALTGEKILQGLYKSFVLLAVPLFIAAANIMNGGTCLLYTSPSPRDKRQSRMPSSA